MGDGKEAGEMVGGEYIKKADRKEMIEKIQ